MQLRWHSIVYKSFQLDLNLRVRVDDDSDNIVIRAQIDNQSENKDAKIGLWSLSINVPNINAKSDMKNTLFFPYDDDDDDDCVNHEPDDITE